MGLASVRPGYDCPQCGDTEPIGYEKDEGPRVKVCLTCPKCGAEWSRWEDHK